MDIHLTLAALYSFIHVITFMEYFLESGTMLGTVENVKMNEAVPQRFSRGIKYRTDLPR